MTARILCLAALTGSLTWAAAAQITNEAALFTPAMLKLRATLSNEVAAAKQHARGPATEILKSETHRWEQEHTERRRTRNIKGIAISEAALDALRKGAESLEARGVVEFPANLRRELTEEFAKLKVRLDSAGAGTAEPIGEVETKAIASFREAAAKAGITIPADDATARQQFAEWLVAKPPPKVVDAPKTTDTDPVTNAPPKFEPPPEFFASSGHGTNWGIAGRWTALSGGPNVFELVVFGATGKKTGRVENPISGRATEWTYESAVPLEVGNYTYRLHRDGTNDVVGVSEWPSIANGGKIVFHTKLTPRIPAETGFELQFTRERLLPIPVRSEPPGARILVDGKAHVIDGKETHTPDTLVLPSGKRAIRLVIPGYHEYEEKEFEVAEGRSMTVTLTPLKDIPSRELTVDPRRAWANTNVRVAQGERIHLKVEGQWSCGKKGDMTGPGGYDPKSPKNSQYYIDPKNAPKQLETAPYGALLVRIGTNKISAIGAARGFVAGSAGLLMFDINESPDPPQRRDNRGKLIVTVEVHPPAPVP